MEGEIRATADDPPAARLYCWKQNGFSDAHIAKLVIPSVSEGAGGSGGAPPAHPGPSLTLGMTEARVRELRHAQGIRPVYKRVDPCAAEREELTPYPYS